MNESGEPRAGVRQLLKRIQLLCSAQVCSGTSGKNAPGKLYFHLNIALMRIEKIRYLEGRVEKLVQESVLARVPIEHVDGYASVQSVHLILQMYKAGRRKNEAYFINLVPVESWDEEHLTRVQDTMFYCGIFEKRKPLMVW